MLEQAVDTGDADVVNGFGAIAHGAGAEEGFFGDGNIAGAGGDDGDGSFAENFGIAFDGDDAAAGMELGGFSESFDGSEDFGVDAGNEDVMVRAFFFEHGADDSGDLLRRFAFAEDDLGETLAEGAMMIDFGEAEVFKREMLEALDGGGGGELSTLHSLQNLQKILMVHSI